MKNAVDLTVLKLQKRMDLKSLKIQDEVVRLNSLFVYGKQSTLCKKIITMFCSDKYANIQYR